jgi:hypothetical protein
MFQAKVVEKIKTDFVFNNPPSENGVVCEKMWGKYCGAGRATDDNTAHARCMLHT